MCFCILESDRRHPELTVDKYDLPLVCIFLDDSVEGAGQELTAAPVAGFTGRLDVALDLTRKASSPDLKLFSFGKEKWDTFRL